jgi:hypothetical protein
MLIQKVPSLATRYHAVSGELRAFHLEVTKCAVESSPSLPCPLLNCTDSLLSNILLYFIHCRISLCRSLSGGLGASENFEILLCDVLHNLHSSAGIIKKR